MPTAQELLSSVTGPEEHIVIGADRYITVPKPLQRIAVQFDHDIETVTFDCPRYWDNIDMSTMTVYINYKLPNGDLDAYPAKNIKADGDIMHFDWTISNKVTQYKGKLTFLVCIKKTGTDGIEVSHWNSELCTDMYISEGMECEEQAQMEYSDLITQLLERMAVVEQININADEMAMLREDVFNESAFITDNITGFQQTTANAIKGSASGESIQIDDVSPVEHNVKTKVCGKNLIDYKMAIPSRFVSICEVIENGIHVEGQYYVKFPVSVKKGTKCTFSCNISNQSGNTTQVGYWLYEYGANDISTSRANGVAMVAEKDVIGIFVYVNTSSNEIGSVDLTDIQFELGDTATEYEPYIDPTTVTVTGCGKNLLNLNKSFDVQGTYGGWLVNPTGKTVTMSLIDKNPNVDISGLYFGFTENGVTTPVHSWMVQNGVINTTTCCAVSKHYYVSVHPVAKLELFKQRFDVLVEYGNTTTDYEPFKGGSYTPNPDGTCDVKSVSPFMQIFTDTPGVTIDAEYNRDIEKVIDYKTGETKFYKFSFAELENKRIIPNSSQTVLTKSISKSLFGDKPSITAVFRLRTGVINSDGTVTKLFDIPVKYNPNPSGIVHDYIINFADFRDMYLVGPGYGDGIYGCEDLLSELKYGETIFDYKFYTADTSTSISQPSCKIVGIAYIMEFIFDDFNVRDASFTQFEQLVINGTTDIVIKYHKHNIPTITPKYLGE